MFRMIIAMIAVVIFFLLSIINIPICLIIGLFSKQKRELAALTFVKGIFKIVLFIVGVKVNVVGEENIISDRAALYTLNHKSIFDVLITYTLMKRQTAFVSKVELKKIPFLHLWMLLVHCIFLDRKDKRSAMTTVIAAMKLLKAGCSVCICPEGTRNKTDDLLLPFKSGSFKIAAKAKAPIVPVAIYNTNAIFEDHKPKLKPANVYIEFFPAIETDTLSKEEQETISEKVYELIYNRLNIIKDENQYKRKPK